MGLLHILKVFSGAIASFSELLWARKGLMKETRPNETEQEPEIGRERDLSRKLAQMKLNKNSELGEKRLNQGISPKVSRIRSGNWAKRSLIKETRPK